MEDRHALLQKINEISFVFNDLTLYLDTHPMDSIACLLHRSYFRIMAASCRRNSI